MQVDKDTTLGELLVKVADQASIETIFSRDQIISQVNASFNVGDIFDEDVLFKYLLKNYNLISLVKELHKLNKKGL